MIVVVFTDVATFETGIIGFLILLSLAMMSKISERYKSEGSKQHVLDRRLQLRRIVRPVAVNFETVYSDSALVGDAPLNPSVRIVSFGVQGRFSGAQKSA